ncbi:hypothetical protein PAAG_08256 [Paracoccidioides lutzii Pb01]|uniref:DH domain-containing protein n=1 Tax=Paracoccidioides lutzii (strain ATCC MYA-826 / Pb01) TaxID=502779 RepID=C1HBW5_PARBA|nr:hypothetical protein PAAG_08256 [Paracoccidioides lutzii Pb01]EEH38529.2 hypothetical protein PAAG_08256 [Paracoccidioides lutzii Pb01]
MEDIRHEEPIFDLTAECEKLFASQISALNDRNEANGAKCLGELNHRFAAWAGFLGVFAESSVCLDRRLRHHAEIQDQVLRLLDIMRRNLTYVFERDDDSPDRMQIQISDRDRRNGENMKNMNEFHFAQPLRVNVSSLEAISSVVDRLNHLGIAIRQSSVTSQMTKARKFAETFNFTSFEEVAYLSLRTLYNNASESLLEQLTRSMTETYALFLHRKSRQTRLQAPRSLPLTPIPLSAIIEEPTADMGGGDPMEIDAQVHLPQPSKDLTSIRILRSRLAQPVRTIVQSEPTSVDSHEFRARIRKKLNPSIKSKTMSILANHADYPRPAKGSLTCEWCFSPIAASLLEGPNWRQHVNEDHEPYVCISEKCSEALPRFATSTQWFQHMLTIHDRNWHREVHAPSSWSCPLCVDEDATFSKSDDLTAHLIDFHEGTFTRPQIDAIVRQSRFRTPRPQDTCPLCCFPMKTQPDLSSKEKGDGNGDPCPKETNHEENVGHKRIKTETGRAHPDHNEGDTLESKAHPKPNTLVDRLIGKSLSVEVVGNHIAAHLQGIMLLTLRLISIDIGIDVSADNQSTSGGTDHNSSWVSSSKGDPGQDMGKIGDFPQPINDDNDPGDDIPLEDVVPDSEYTNWHNVPRAHEDPLEENILEDELIRLGIVQPRSYGSKHSLPSRAVQSEDELKILQKHRSRLEVIQKIVDAEVRFTREMTIVNEIYKASSSACMELSADDVKVLFGNSEEVLSFSLGFQTALKKAAESAFMPRESRNIETTKLHGDDEASEKSHTTELDFSTFIGRAFMDHLPRMEKVYWRYLKNNDAANMRLRTLQSNSKISNWLTECYEGSSDMTTAGLDLLLIRPAQHLLQYSILLDELLQWTPSDHPDWTCLTEAVFKLRSLPAHIDTVKKRDDIVNQTVNQKRKTLDVKTGLNRAFGRRTATLADRSDPDEEFRDKDCDVLTQKLGESFFQMQLVMMDVKKYTAEVQSSTDRLKQIVNAIAEFVSVMPTIYPGLESKWVRWRSCMQGIISGALVDHITLVRTTIIEPLDTALKLHSKPQAVSQERTMRFPHYVRFKVAKGRNIKLDKKTTEKAQQFIALNETLKEELPKFFTLCARLVETCLNNLVHIQNGWFRQLETELGTVIDSPPVDIPAIIHEWSADFSFSEAQVLSLGMCNGSILAEQPNSLNPLSRINTGSTEATSSLSRQPSTANSRSVRDPVSRSRPSYRIPDPLFGEVGGPSSFDPAAPSRMSTDTTSSLPKLTLDTPFSVEFPDSSIKPRDSLPKQRSGQYFESSSRSLVGGKLRTDEGLSESNRERSPAEPEDGFEVLFIVASLFEFHNSRASQVVSGYQYLQYDAGEVFDVFAEKGELWLARNQDDPDCMIGWIWTKHFAKLSQC